MTHKPEPNWIALEHFLREGIASTEYADPREELGCAPDAEDRDVARELVRSAATYDIEEIGTESLNPEAARHPSVRPPPEGAADPSFLGRLSASGTGRISVEQIDDIPTILAVLRAGSRKQRRAALERLGERLQERRAVSNEAVRAATQTIGELRDVELGYELARLRSELPGAPGRKARSEDERWRRLAAETQEAVRAFWDGQSQVEPIHVLPGDERALLLMRTPELPAMVLHHINAIIEGNDGCVPRESRVGLLASLRHATDTRLVPALVAVIESERGELLAEAAWVLGGIDDPRAHPALVERFERSSGSE